jgi:hypothetical protein
MSTIYPNLIAYATKLEAELNCTIPTYDYGEKLICHYVTQQH